MPKGILPMVVGDGYLESVSVSSVYREVQGITGQHMGAILLHFVLATVYRIRLGNGLETATNLLTSFSMLRLYTYRTER